MKLKEYEIIESKAYIVHAFNEAHALRKFGNYDYVSEGDVWPDVRELGVVNSSGTGPGQVSLGGEKTQACHLNCLIPQIFGRPAL